MKPTKTIKERLIERFNSATMKIGTVWRVKLVAADPEFNSFDGGKLIQQTSVLGSRPASMNVDKLEKITLAVEKLAGMETEPVA